MCVNQIGINLIVEFKCLIVRCGCSLMCVGSLCLIGFIISERVQWLNYCSHVNSLNCNILMHCKRISLIGVLMDGWNEKQYGLILSTK